MEMVKPDGRGRIPLARFVSDLADQYLVKVSANGVISLVPATVRPAVLDEVETIVPSFEADLAVAVESDAGSSSFWESVRPPSSDAR